MFIEQELATFKPSGQLEKDIVRLFRDYDMNETADHVLQVTKAAETLANQYGQNIGAARTAALLHDIGGIIPQNQMVTEAEYYQLAVFPEERELPMLLHQRLSRIIAEKVFNITDQHVLNAVSCHTTLKHSPTTMDMLVFIADKLEWDRKHRAPYLTDLQKALDNSLEQACICYIQWVVSTDLLVLHPWLDDAVKWFGLDI